MSEVDFGRTSLPKGGVKFVSTFLRFEFALKECGFCPRDGDAKVNRGRMTAQLGDGFYAFISRSAEAQTILAKPPKGQIFQDHRLSWRDCAPPKNAQELFEAVRRVRNNLVHRGKAGDREFDPEDPQRDEKLLHEAQWIIEQALLDMDQVRDYFEGKY